MKPLPNISKVTPPRIPRVLERLRLLELLRENCDKKLILILGQAAQGKSTLASSYVKVSETPFAWINLGPEDSDPVNLFYALVQALQRTLPEVDFSPVLAYPSLAMGPREEFPLHRDWTLAIFNLIAVPMGVVFDGLDCLDPGAPAHRFLQVLVDYAPVGLSLILVSREMPPLSVQDLLMRREAYILNNADLAFTLEETRDFFRTIQGLPLPLDHLHRIHRLTEGWVGGLVLLSNLLLRLPAKTGEDYLLEAKFKGEVFRYFGDSIFSPRPAAEQEFFLKSSILEVVEAGLVGDLTGLPNAYEILQDLDRKNLFVTSVYDRRRGWLFRYHQLFREFLQNKFDAAFERQQQQAIYLRAGQLFAAGGDLEEALKYYLKARAYLQAATALEEVGLGLVKLGRTGDLSRCLEDLPKGLVQKNPWLLFYSFITRRFKSSPEALAALQLALDLFEERGEAGGALHCLAYLVEACANGYLLAPLGPLLSRAETFLLGLGSDQYPYERAALRFQVAFAYTLRGDNPRKGFQACQNAYLLARDLGDLPLQLHSLTNAQYCLSVLGEFAEAEEWCQKADRVATQCAYPEVRGWYLAIKSNSAMLRGDFKQAEGLLRLAEEETQRHGLVYLYPITMITKLALLIFSPGDYAETEKLGLAILNMTSAMGNLFLEAMSLWLLGICYYHKGDLSAARETFALAREKFSAQGAMSIPHFNLVKIHQGLLYQVAVKWVGAGSPRPGSDEAENGGRGNPAPTTPTTNITCLRATWY